MLILIAKAFSLFMIILTVSSIVFAALATLVGKFFNVTIASDSVWATLVKKLHQR